MTIRSACNASSLPDTLKMLSQQKGKRAKLGLSLIMACTTKINLVKLVKFKGICLNGCLYQGPDLNNNLLGVLLRFRPKSIAIQADVESMFHQTQIPIEDRDLIRFLWWKDGNIENEQSKLETVSPSPSHNTSDARTRNRQNRSWWRLVQKHVSQSLVEKRGKAMLPA